MPNRNKSPRAATKRQDKLSKKIMAYYWLAKPGIIRGNVLVAAAGFLFASKGTVDLPLGLWLVTGTSLIIASACVFNNIYDRHIDAHMQRTKKRALVSGDVSVFSATVYGIFLLVAGIAVLTNFVGVLALLVGLVGFIDYVLIYTPLKTHTHHATMLGGISGSTPPVAGYVAVTNQLDATALLLFLILLMWQMPHFFAIALFRDKEYQSANVPIHPLVKGARSTKIQMLIYAVGFLLACILLSLEAKTSTSFTVVMTALGIYWLWYGIKSFGTTDVAKWAKGMFGISLLILLAFSATLGLDFWLP